MKLRWSIPFLLAIAGFTIGYLQENPTAAPKGLDKGTADSAILNEKNNSSAKPHINEEHRLGLDKQLRIIQSEPSRSHRVHDFVQLFAAMSLNELLEAAKLVASMPESSRDDAQGALALRMLAIDPQEAAKFVDSVQEENSNISSLLAKAWVQKDRPAALLWMAQSWDSGGQIFAAEILQDWAATDPAKAAELIHSAPSRFGKEGVTAVFERWSAKDPSAAMASAETITNTPLRRTAMEATMKGWVESDFAAAYDWFQRLDDPMIRNELALGLAVGRYMKDPVQAVEIVRTLPEGSSRNRALAELVEHGHFTTRKTEALALLSTIPFERDNEALEGVYRSWLASQGQAESAVEHLLRRLDAPSINAEERDAIEDFLKTSLVQPADSAKELANMKETPGKDAFYRTLELSVASWAREDPETARAWAEALPAGARRNSALAGALSTWAAGSRVDAAAWLDQQPPSATRDAATSGFVKGALCRDPTGTLTRSRTIADATQRLSALEEGWKNWTIEDRAAAEKWRDHAPELTGVERQSLQTLSAK